ncbi:hypothetical protein BBJ28_00006925 [Nothophytophthora sp. Chile5]|nr:hypothetical protein BBJ28_00006925 [Nothophytophthora sp. Chile5]
MPRNDVQDMYDTSISCLPTCFVWPVQVVTLCREIFQRSVAFRALVATQTASFYERLLVAAGEELKSSGASCVSRALRAKARASPQLTMALALIETWKQDFGDRYPPLVAGHAVLMERGYVFPQERERQQEARQQAVDTRRHRDRVREAKRQQRDQEMAQIVPEMEQVLVEMNRIFEILVPTLDAFQVLDGDTETPPANDVGIEPHQGEEHDEDDSDGVEWEDAAPPTATSVHAQEKEEEEDVDWETVAPAEHGHGDADSEEETEHRMDINEIIQAYGLGSSSYQLTVEVSTRVCEESADNAVLFQTLADDTLRLRKRFLPLLDDWEQYSTGPGPSASSSSTAGATGQHEILQRIGDLRDRMTRVLLKWEDLVQDNKQTSNPVAPAVVTLPLASYDPPATRQRRRNTRL